MWQYADSEHAPGRWAHVMNPMVILRVHSFSSPRENISTHLLVNEAQCVYQHKWSQMKYHKEFQKGLK